MRTSEFQENRETAVADTLKAVEKGYELTQNVYKIYLHYYYSWSCEQLDLQKIDCISSRSGKTL